LDLLDMHLPVDDGSGYLTVDLSEAKRVLQWRKECDADLRSRGYPMNEMATCPEPTRWLALHPHATRCQS
jgi:hypothetical protein